MSKSVIESVFYKELKTLVEAGGQLEREFRFHPIRRWRADFAFPRAMLLIEVEGGVYTRGRHTRGAGYTKDCEKYNEAAIMGYTVLRFTPGMIESGDAIDAVRRALRWHRNF